MKVILTISLDVRALRSVVSETSPVAVGGDVCRRLEEVRKSSEVGSGPLTDFPTGRVPFSRRACRACEIARLIRGHRGLRRTNVLLLRHPFVVSVTSPGECPGLVDGCLGRGPDGVPVSVPVAARHVAPRQVAPLVFWLVPRWCSWLKRTAPRIGASGLGLV